MRMIYAASALLLSLLSTSVTAQELIQNGSFETGDMPPAVGTNGRGLQVGDQSITGWTVFAANPATSPAGKDIAWLPKGNGFGLGTPFGDRFLDLTGYDDRTPYLGVTQSINTDPGQSYNLTFYLGVNNTAPGAAGPVSVQASAGLVSSSFAYVAPMTMGDSYGLQTLNFVATGATTSISILALSPGTGTYIGLDNVSVMAAPVPGPLAGAGLIPLFGFAGAWYAGRRKVKLAA